MKKRSNTSLSDLKPKSCKSVLSENNLGYWKFVEARPFIDPFLFNVGDMYRGRKIVYKDTDSMILE